MDRIVTGLRCTGPRSQNVLIKKTIVILAHTCSKSKEEIRAKQTTINRPRQSASTEADEIIHLEDDILALNQELERHRQVANESHKYYVQVTERCSSEWNEISELEKKIFTDQ